jgi:molybdopterin-guanine dinucleotide biosynthesis protein A
MEAAGFVLAGGRSSRMGRDKALLPYSGRTLLEHVASAVEAAIGNVTVIGPPERYTNLGLRVIPDVVADAGPLGGLVTALRKTRSSWSLLVACDMPNLTSEMLYDIAKSAVDSDADAVVCDTGRLHPLCAVYHRRLLPAAESALQKRELRMHDFLATIRVERWPVADPTLLANLNTPEELHALEIR